MDTSRTGFSKAMQSLLKRTFAPSLEQNLSALKTILKDDDAIVYRTFTSLKDDRLRFACIYADGMVNGKMLCDNLILPLSYIQLPEDGEIGQTLLESAVSLNDAADCNTLSDAVEAILYGDTVVLAEGYAGAVSYNSKGWSMRGISEPDSEKALRGPRDGFVESIMTNTALIRLRLQTSDFKCRFLQVGTRTNTRVALCYLESLADDGMLAEIERRLSKIDIDGVLESNYVEELIQDARHSPFQTMGTTEKPDVAAAKLLEGRIALIVDGTPVVLTMPFLFIENLQASDDYYLNPYMASFGRFLRIFGFLFSIITPALYVALVTFHQEMIPSTLLINISAATQGVPMTTAIECIVMLLMFEILRETGVRMPNKIGQALSIVGALVLGQAAVEAKIASAPTIIVVAFTGITGLMVPNLSMPLLICRLFTLILSSALGLYGMFYALLAILLHMLSLQSLGVFYLQGFGAHTFQGLKDIYWRAPFWKMLTRPFFVKKDPRRMG